VRLTGEVQVELAQCAIAVFKDPDELAVAMSELDKAGLEYYVLEGETGQESLQPKQEGVAATLKRLASAFGDELRIMDRLDRSLAEGDQVVIVKAEDDQAELVEMLTERGGRFLWQFREWTFNTAGSANTEDNTVAEEDVS
jgi:hypothetical protein